MLYRADRRCEECLFSDKRIVSQKRRAQILRDCLQHDRHFVCHKGTIVSKDVVCAGFYERYPGVGQMVRIAQRLGVLRSVNPDSLTKKACGGTIDEGG
jgi:hypothetical protein